MKTGQRSRGVVAMSVRLPKQRQMTVRGVAEALGCVPETVKEHVRKIYPDLMKNGYTTYLTEAQVTAVLESMKAGQAYAHHVSGGDVATYNSGIVGAETGQSLEFQLALIERKAHELWKRKAIEQERRAIRAENELHTTQALLAEMKTGLEAIIQRVAGAAGPVPKRKRGKRLSAEPCLEISGEKNPNAKLTEAEVREIKIALASGESTGALARKYGVAKPTICHIKTGRLWSWLQVELSDNSQPARPQEAEALLA